ncbi:phage/plasmid primase, P4 family [Paenibacillus sp. V4I7]|uniref:DNA primase family protein n=1 Tax=Paenibacillus sp. V4I7 TaxID=3042307 RepID=UPI00278798E9|nr:phage/plasmid primase, P4 family [Paenibacillus sp. V4I7]MDQ0902771.1 P4 family phage/plasmid primase-like protein [Paenibacillus sp. V4I7]
MGIKLPAQPIWMMKRMILSPAREAESSEIQNNFGEAHIEQASTCSIEDSDPDLVKLTKKCQKVCIHTNCQLVGGGCDEQTWHLIVSMLARSGHPEAALAFSMLSAKHDSHSEERIRQMIAEGQSASYGPTRCTTFGCGLEQIERCHGKVLRNSENDVVNSPARLLMPDQTSESLQVAQSALKLVESGDHGAHLEPEVLQSFLRLRSQSPAEYARLEQRLRAAKVPMRTFNQALKDAQNKYAQTQSVGGALAEMGFYLDASGTPNGMNQNKYARYVLTQLALGVAEGERFYLYENGVWGELNDLAIKRKLRDYLHDLVPDFWTEKLEEQYVGALLREAEYLDEIDGQRDYINLQNGMLSLGSFELLPHDRRYHSTIQIRIPYTPDAKCPQFMQFLNEVFLGDQELVRVGQEMFGYCLTAETRAEKCFVLFGEGSNGKSVLLNVLKLLCGRENTSSVPLAELENAFARHEIVGKTLNLAAENEVDEKGLNTQYFKAIVSGDPIHVDVKYGKGFMYEPVCKLVFATNRLPYSRDKSHAFPRRLIIFPFRAKFSSKTADKHLREKLEAELPGILNFALEGLKRLRDQNYVFSHSQAAEQMLTEYRATINPMLSFVKDCIEPTPGTGRVGRTRLREEFQHWCRDNGHTGLAGMTTKKFWDAFRKVLDEERIEYTESKSNGLDCFVGISMKNTGPQKYFRQDSSLSKVFEEEPDDEE